LSLAARGRDRDGEYDGETPNGSGDEADAAARQPPSASVSEEELLRASDSDDEGVVRSPSDGEDAGDRRRDPEVLH